jgi:large conductance mechanosensitive channel
MWPTCIIADAGFGKIVLSFIESLLVPPLGLLVGEVGFSSLAITLKTAVSD